MAKRLILPASYYAQRPPAEPERRRQELQLLIKPVSGKCNLRCDYCFYRPVQEKLYPDAKVMSGEVLEEMIRQFLGMRLQQTSFSWQGGEPTLAGLDFFKEAVRLMMKYGSGGQSVGNAFQTNGILIDDRWADFLARYRFLVGVSIDGPAEIHDRYRGRCHSKVMRGARTAMKLGVEVNVLSCVSRANEGRAKETYDFFKEHDFKHVQYIPIVEFTDGPERFPEFNVRPEAYGDFLIEIFDLWQADPEPTCIRLFDSLIEFAGTGRSPFCILAPVCASYLVVEATGELYPCDFFVRDGLRIGSLFDVPLAEARKTEVVKEFSKIKLRRPARCRDCEWWKVCRGGCLKEREAAAPVDTLGDAAAQGDEGPFDRPGHLCEGMKRFLDHSWKEFERLGKLHFGPHGQPQSRHDRPSPCGDSQPTLKGRLASRVGAASGLDDSVASGRKARPNEPCPCGSGKKYKRCCARR